MTRFAAVLALTGSFLAGAAAMAWYLTRWHDDRDTGPTYVSLDEPGGGFGL